MNLLSRTTSYVLSISVAAAAANAACDLPQKDIGDESDSAGASDSNDSDDSDSGSGQDTLGGACEPGDEIPAPDGCNTCFCDDDGNWGCTEIGCSDTVFPGGECEDGDVQPADDGCNSCFCEDGLWSCTLIGCGDTDEPPDTDGGTGGPGFPGTSDPFENNGVHICDEMVPYDPIVVNDASIVGNELLVDVAYSGGCAMHLIGTCWDGEFLESFPVQVRLALAHEDNDDPCDAFPSEQRVFDLASLAEAYQDAYQEPNGTIIIGLEGFAGGELNYTF